MSTPGQTLLRLLIFHLALLCLPQPILAQDAERQTLGADQLPGPTAYRDPAQRAQALSGAVLRLRATPPRQPWITTVGDPALYGAATLVQTPEGPALLTGEFFVRGQETLELLYQGRALPTRVLRADRALGLALLELPEALAGALTPAPVRDKPLLSWEQPWALVFDRQGAASAVAVRFQGRPKQEELSFYMSALPTLGEGHPIFDDKGALVGLFALRVPGEPLGYALMTEVLARFFAPSPEPGSPQPLNLEVLGGGQEVEFSP